MKSFASEYDRSPHDREIDDLRRASRDGLPMRIIVSALLLGIVVASTTLYLNGLDRAANLVLH